ncbi:TPA: hypothetical protein EYP37_05500 [Candidatus Poribacteria bacterium]|nr:hypothetical protein [Candidatus Poribacteria bacterium]
MSVERIRELTSLLNVGLADYDQQQKILQEERLKFIRLSITNGFGEDENSSREAWLLHLKQLEDSLIVRLEAMRRAILEAARDLEGNRKEGS